jgi:WD40 repeat protein
VTAADDSRACLWNAADGTTATEPLTQSAAVVSVEFSADSQKILTASNDHTVQVWDRETGQPLIKPLRLDDKVTMARFSPDGALIITASADGTARVWDAETGQPLEQFHHDKEVFAAESSGDARRIVTASADKTAGVWDFAPRPLKTHVWLPQLAELICRGQLTEKDSFIAMEKPPADLLNQIRQELTTDSEHDDWVVWARWFLSDPAARTISPFSAITVSNYIEQKIKEDTDASLHAAEMVSLGNPELAKRIANARAALHQNIGP